MTHTLPVQQAPELPYTQADPDQLGTLYKFLRVVDVVDAMDGIGYFNIGLMNHDVRPLWRGMKFFGEAATLRCVPSNKPMWKLTSTEDVVAAHRLWFEKYPAERLPNDLTPGHVVVMDSGGGPEVGFWGSENAMGTIVGGAVGIITDGYARDTGELEAQGTPVVARRRGRTIIPGRIEAVEAQTQIACGGTQVNPGDVVGADDDGVVVVPREVAVEVATHARAVLLSDMRARKRHYDKLGRPGDASTDVEAVEAWYANV
ncbi:RraA family protein [Auraticoccus monumenti]|uniref:Putative 4-hydroxy-4-methyl-2-oxoglutarate aldolase n=1 Tax=Auraticoccus monumenti TaxID=675864 RepID=A0A1G6VDC8_9ACTN|nr:RraA family protein [Auraticoccus monumenti]SDD51474.1 Regulator of RNase E activity RraA [Auraticoccus monumenti]